MVLQVKQFSFSKSTDNVNLPLTETPVINLGFTPKAVILYTSANTTTGTHQRFSMGFATSSSSQRAVGWASGSTTSITNGARIDSNQDCLRVISESGAEHCTIDLVSFNSTNGGSITFTYTANTTGSYPIHGIALGGDDITNVSIGTITTPTATGSQPYTITPNFQPDMLFFLTTGAGSTLNQFSGTGSRIGFGAAASTTRRATLSTTSRDGQTTSTTRKVQHAQRAIQLLDVDNGVTTKVLEADLTAKSSTGFTLNYTTVPTTQIPLFYLAIKGGGWDVGSITSPTTTGNQTVTTTFPPKLVMLTSTQSTTNNSITAHARFQLGSATSVSAGTETGSVWYGDKDAVTPTVVSRASSTSHVLRHYTEDASTVAILEREATLAQLNAGNFVLNWGTVSATGVQIHAIIAGDTPPPPTTTVTKPDFKLNYHIKAFVNKTTTLKYDLGGAIEVGPIQHTYDILGPITKTGVLVYGIRTFLTKTAILRYTIANVTVECTLNYDIDQPFLKSAILTYDIAEHPSLNLQRYLKPLGIRIFIMSHDQTETFHVYNSFNLHESTFKLIGASINPAIGESGEFSFTVEDSRHGIDTSLVGEGNAVLIQAAKTESDLGDGNHNLIFGYIVEKNVVRPDTNVLLYEFSGYGSMIRFSERLTNFSKSARRVKHDSPEPDTTDPDMIAYRLFTQLLDTADHMPIGGPRETQFTHKGVDQIQPRVEGFIANIEEELAEMSSPMDFIADSTGATWGVHYNPDLNDVFLRYATLEPSGIIIKGGSDVENRDDDRFKTAYILGEWSFTDSRDKSQGFTNRFFARVGTKKVTANVIEINQIIDQFTPLAVNDPPTDENAGSQLPEGRQAAFGPIINIRSDLIGPFSPVWSNIANMARQFNWNVFYCVLKFGTGTDGPGPSAGIPDWVTPWNELDAARVKILGYIDTNNGNKTEAAVREEIDRWVNTWGPLGIFFDNVDPTLGKLQYYNSISGYAKSFGINTTVGNARKTVPAEYYSTCDSYFGTECPNISIYVVNETGGRLPNHDTELQQPFYSGQSSGQSHIISAKRAVFAYGITTAAATDDDIAQWVSDGEVENTFSWFYVTDDGLPQPYDTLSGRLQAAMFGAEQAAIRIFQNVGWIVPGIPTQQDLAMSFTADTQNLGDIAVILSKKGNPIPEEGEGPHAYIEILSNRQVTRTTTDPNTGAVSTEIVSMPSFAEPIAFARIPFDKIQNEFPTVIFLHDFVKRQQDIQVGNKYWVVMYGRGQNEENTIRWHHANDTESTSSSGTESQSARRVPAAYRYRSETQRQQWQVFSKTTHPGFALSRFKNTTHLLEASDSDSIDRFGLVESELDLTGIDDDAMAIKAMHSILDRAAKPKRLYNIGSVTPPDDLILPGMLVRIHDDMTLSGQVTGSTAEGTEAEILSASYDFSASDRPMGCYQINIEAVGHVDFAWAYWYAKYKRGDISVDFPDIQPRPRGPPPNTSGPVVLVDPKGGTYGSALTVIFITNRTGVKIFYTVNGTTPVMTGAGTPSSENDTRLWTPGASPPIKITETTTLKFQGIDSEGRTSTVYTEVYNIKTANPGSGGGGGGTGGGGIIGAKHMSMPYWKGPSLSTIESVFDANMNATFDYITYHKREQEIYDTVWTATALSTPSKLAEAEFEGFTEMKDHFATAKSEGFDIIGYNIESDESYTSEHKKDVVGFCIKFSDYVKSRGLAVKFNPSADYTKTYGSRIVRYCQYYNIQGQHLQHDTEKFRTWVRETAQSLRANNSNVIITVGLSADLKQHGSVKGQTRLQTLQNRWTYAKNYVDGVRLFYKTDDEVNNIVRPFMQWFTQNGRSV